jgi:hypothetical protein
MFVACDHIIRVPGLPNPTTAPELIATSNQDSLLATGTYYVAYSLANENGETMVSDFSKIYLNEAQSLDIKFELYSSLNPVENISIYSGIYIGYTEENMLGQLTEAQLVIEDAVIKGMTRQGISNDGEYSFSGPIVPGKMKSGNNLTLFKTYVDIPTACPRCYGKGFYFDIFFDVTGQAVTAESSIKLLQELLKIVIEDRDGNVFHPEWGSDINKRIGSKKRGIADKFKIEISVRNAIEYLRGVQEGNQRVKKNMRPEEMIADIQSIVVTEDGPTGYNVYVEVLSKAGEVIAYNVNL